MQTSLSASLSEDPVETARPIVSSSPVKTVEIYHLSLCLRVRAF